MHKNSDVSNNASVYDVGSIRKPVTRSDTLILTQKFNKKYFDKAKKNIEISHFSIIKDDIKKLIESKIRKPLKHHLKGLKPTKKTSASIKMN
jgi:hypothetical protein